MNLSSRDVKFLTIIHAKCLTFFITRTLFLRLRHIHNHIPALIMPCLNQPSDKAGIIIPLFLLNPPCPVHSAGCIQWSSLSKIMCHLILYSVQRLPVFQFHSMSGLWFSAWISRPATLRLCSLFNHYFIIITPILMCRSLFFAFFKILLCFCTFRFLPRVSFSPLHLLI